MAEWWNSGMKDVFMDLEWLPCYLILYIKVLDKKPALADGIAGQFGVILGICKIFNWGILQMPKMTPNCPKIPQTVHFLKISQILDL